jgi:16S rRNA (uracil1498-N3)-methyltransferase
MTTLRVPLSSLEPGERLLAKDAAHYVTRVRRLEPGMRFVAFDPEARQEADAELIEGDRRGGVRVRIHEPRPASVLPTREVTLIQCVGKADKLDAVVRDATELDATAVLPAISARSVATRASDAAVGRLRRIALEAARQCGRGDVPRVERPAPLADVLRAIGSELRLLLQPGAALHASSALERLTPGASVAIAIGPEGGFADDEVVLAMQAGFLPVRLGSTVLRTETVAAAMLGALLLRR